MKKIFIALCCVILLLSTAKFGRCENDDDYFTNGYINGRLVLEVLEVGKYSKQYYVLGGVLRGLLECLEYKGYGDEIRRLYGNADKSGILKAICDYYKTNPAQRNRPIIDVLLSGAK